MRWVFASVLAFFVLVVAVWLFWAFHSVAIANWALGNIFIPAQAGPWGDSFGAFNALFGALGFTAILGTLILQGQSIRRQESDQHQQRFEGVFFELLGILRQTREEVRFSQGKDFLTALGRTRVAGLTRGGREAFGAAAQEARYWLLQEEKTMEKVSKERVAGIYRTRIHSRYESSLSPYFRLVYTLLDRLRHDRILSIEDKYRYANILRSQLTTRELELISLNSLTVEAKDMRELVVMFRLLKYLPEGSMRRRMKRYYPKETFEGRD